MDAGTTGPDRRHDQGGVRLEEQYAELSGVLLRYLRSMADGSEDDLASQVWTEATAGFAGFSGDAPTFRRWLFTIARRRLIDHRRRWWQRRVVLRGTPPELWEDAAASDPDGTGEALELIGRLPRSHAEIVFLRVIAGLSAADVAAITGRSPETVRVMQHRALRTLASMLGSEVNDA